MYVIRDKKSKTILHMRQSYPDEHLKPEEVFKGFDPKTMEFGRSETPAVPAWFTIVDGVIKAEEPPPSEQQEAPAAPPPSLEQVKAATIAQFSRLAFDERKRLIPDHEMQNAALGVYDEKRTQAIRDTIKAFRDEYHRLEAAVKKARSVREVQSIKPAFPDKVEAAAGGTSKKEKKS